MPSGTGDHYRRRPAKKDIPPIKFIADRLIPIGLNILASPLKYGKSWMVLALCLSVTMECQPLGGNGAGPAGRWPCSTAGTGEGWRVTMELPDWLELYQGVPDKGQASGAGSPKTSPVNPGVAIRTSGAVPTAGRKKAVPTCGHDDYIPENIFYRLAMKAKNTAAAFWD